MGHSRNKPRLDLLKQAFQGHRPNTIRVYASRLKALANRLGKADIPCSGHDILSPWWLADPDRVMKILQQEKFSTNTIKSYLTAVTALLNHLSSTVESEGDRSAARLLEGIYRSKHASMGP
jgi:hypothetical protein